MRIEQGAETPAQIAMENGTVLFEGTYTACGKLMDSLGAYFGFTNSDERVEQLQAEVDDLRKQVETLERLRPNWRGGLPR